MKSKTLKELRAHAKARGLKGYSKWTKDELVRRLEEPKAAHTPEALAPLRARSLQDSEAREATRSAPAFPAASQPVRAEPAPAPVQPSPPHTAVQTRSDLAARQKQRSASAFSTTSQPVKTEPAPTAVRSRAAHTAVESRSTSEEERVEGAKYALRPNGKPAPPPPVDLGEDIDRLPALTEPTLCLLSQKPGVLYAYWLLPPGATHRRDDYKLRLCRTAADALQVYQEIPVPFERGGWYFQVPENIGGHEMLVQLGYYQDGKFVAAQGQSTARLPSLYASTRTDHRWWISDEDFARMYMAAGGTVTGAHRYGWSGSSSSPSAAPGAPSSAQNPPETRMVWPGGVSSPSK